MGSKPETPQAQETPLEGLTNEQLLAMLTPLQKDRASLLSQKLTAAGDEILSIGTDLRLRASLLRWDGEGADAFVEWTGATALATMKLGEYAKKAGTCLSDVAQAIAEASSGVDGLAKSSAGAQSSYTSAQKALQAAKHDPDGGKDAAKDASSKMAAAEATREATRIAAMMKLRSLGQTYTHSGQQINKEPVPEFPPPAGYLGGAWRAGDSYRQLPSSSSTSKTSSTTDRYDSTGRTESVGKSEDSVTGTVDSGTVRPADPLRPADPIRPGTVLPDRPVDMEIDGIATLPERPTSPTAPPTTLGPRPEGLGPHTGIATPFPPTTYPGGTQGGLPPAGTGRTAPGMRGITGPGMPPGGTTASRMPRDTGIVGGRAVPPNSGRPTGGIPRGTVIGTESGGYGRGMAGGGMVGGHGGIGGQGGTAAGRRLATETGGVVGGRAQHAGQGGARPFTPGGSGLVRGGQPGTRAGDERRDERNGERPDYLVEEEETWQPGSRRIVPPVVD
ncbi:hypothetical protein ACF06X_00300 [Streptomyces sp. NPDC015346]|uniref:hypothetical protein n=1 Tax=Streptomyces sp. NPDC015346 TaxID=3364954 RepID=UPI003702E2AD